MAETGERGRPTQYTPEIADKICKHIAGGGSLRSICEGDDMPAHSTVLLWVVEDREGFSDHYHRAREAAGYAHADRVVATVDKVEDGSLEPNAAKAMIYGLQWAAERMSPKRHSPRQELAHTSPDGSMSPKDASLTKEQALELLKKNGMAP